MIKPDARIVPTEEEFQAWCEHPCTRFVAASYAAKAQECRDRWTAFFGRNLIPVDLDVQRRELFAKEECFRAFFESHYLDFLRSADPRAWEALMQQMQEGRDGRRPASASQTFSRTPLGY